MHPRACEIIHKQHLPCTRNASWFSWKTFSLATTWGLWWRESTAAGTSPLSTPSTLQHRNHVTQHKFTSKFHMCHRKMIPRAINRWSNASKKCIHMAGEWLKASGGMVWWEKVVINHFSSLFRLEKRSPWKLWCVYISCLGCLLFFEPVDVFCGKIDGSCENNKNIRYFNIRWAFDTKNENILSVLWSGPWLEESLMWNRNFPFILHGAKCSNKGCRQSQARSENCNMETTLPGL